MEEQNEFDDSSWNEWAQRQQADADNAAMAERIRAGQEVFDGYRQLGDQAMSEQRQRNRRAALNLLSGFKLAAMRGDGIVPNYALVGMGDALGYNNEKNGVLQGAVINPKDGSFGLVVQDGSGNVATKPFTFAQMYNMALENPGVFTRDELRYLRDGSIRTRKLTPDMANRDLPMVPDNYGEVRTPVGEVTPSGGVSVPGAWLYGQRRYGGSVSSADGRGGFSRTSIGADGSVTREDYGTRSPSSRGRWKVLSVGADPNSSDGTQIRRYENSETGEVVSVRDGETPPWERATSGMGEKERIARMNNESRERIQKERGQAQRDVAQATADATKRKADASVEVASQTAKSKTLRGGGSSDAQDLSSVRRILDKNSGATPEQRNAAINKLLGIADRYEQRLGMSDKDMAMKRADDIIDLYGGDVGGFSTKDKEQIRKAIAGELYAGKEYGPEEWESYFDNLRAQVQKASKNGGKAEVKTNDNGGANGKQYKEGDEQEINGIKMKLLPSKKNPGKLTWQRV